MNEWKKLQIDNLPLDILTGDYEFKCGKGSYDDTRLPNGFNDRFTYLDVTYDISQGKDFNPYYYRKPEPKQPNYETLAECYINDDMGPLGLNLPHDLLRDAIAEIQDNCEREVKLAFIAGRESADIPPKGSKV